MKYHLTSLHTSIWDIVKFGAQEPSVGDEDYDADEVAQIQHLNSQATTILLTSLSREEYNKVQGLESAKEIWDILKTTHEGDEVTKITKMETIEGELGRFMLHQGEEPCWNLLSAARRPTRVNGGDNRVTCSGANSSVDLASHGHCAGVFIGI